jgi:hypothetical protein
MSEPETRRKLQALRNMTVARGCSVAEAETAAKLARTLALTLEAAAAPATVDDMRQRWNDEYRRKWDEEQRYSR